jgi:decaprenylphospho-beta-D-ribofuranose 2-oxidase
MTNSNGFPYLKERLSIFVDGNNMFYAQQKNGWFFDPRRVLEHFTNDPGVNLINAFTIRIFNWCWFYKPLGKQFQQVMKYMHPLDGISNWNVVYGKKGMIQYQFVVPFEQGQIINVVLQKLSKAKCASFLTVLKSFGEETKGLLSFPMRGWTLAIDFPASNKNLSTVLREIDELVLQSGGRVYLTKDSLADSRHIASMYPKLDEWKLAKIKYDPDNCWQSDQGRRLKLC